MSTNTEFDHIPKKLEAVQVTLTSGDVLSGNIHLGHHQRVSDLFNEDRPFIPFHHDDGTFELINVGAVARVVPGVQHLDRPRPLPRYIGPKREPGPAGRTHGFRTRRQANRN